MIILTEIKGRELTPTMSSAPRYRALLLISTQQNYPEGWKKAESAFDSSQDPQDPRVPLRCDSGSRKSR